MEKTEISEQELKERLALSRKRMSDPFYSAEQLFDEPNPGWPGDKEGRALLAFVSLARSGEEPLSDMEKTVRMLPGRLNEKGYIGEITEEIFEQQLSGHNWLLRGLSEYYELTGDKEALTLIDGIVENLYLPLTGKIRHYPLHGKEDNDGGVEGHTKGAYKGWLLSTDTCCAFMAIDGLSHVYKLTKDERIRTLLDEMTDTFMKIDKRAVRAQTHTTLTAAREMLRLYGLTGDESYLSHAESIYTIYTRYAMTYTYENYNWWERPDSWTEPCAVVDSLMLAGGLYEITHLEKYRRMAARIWHNGFASIQRCNGGAGTQTIVYEDRSILEINCFEARQCCSMRLAEGLLYAKEHRDFLYAETSPRAHRDRTGVYSCGDLVAAQTVGEESKGLHPLIKYYTLTEEETRTLKQRVVFDVHES